MKESAQIGHTVARAILVEKEPDNTFFANSKLHLHVPAGATPKAGHHDHILAFSCHEETCQERSSNDWGSYTNRENSSHWWGMFSNS